MPIRIPKKLLFTFLALGLLLMFSAFSMCTDKNEDDDDDDEPLVLTLKNYPRVDGSTSAEPLQKILACRMLGAEYYWSEYWDGSHRVFALENESAPENTGGYINDNIRHNGTHGSYVNLIENNADLILVAREPSQDELDLAKEKSVELDVRPVALDAFVFIVNIDNPAYKLTTEQVQGIYTGEITNWTKIVNGANADINAYQRNDNSGSQELMERLVMKDLEMIDAPEMILGGMMGPINMISRDVDGIGYSVYFYEQFMAPNEKLQLVEMDGVMPTFENIQAKTYPYTTEVYIVTRANAKASSPENALREWMLSEVGQEFVGLQAGSPAG